MRITLAVISFFISMELLKFSVNLLSRKKFRHPLYFILGLVVFLTIPWTISYGIMFLTDKKDIAQYFYRASSTGWTIGLCCWCAFFYELYLYISHRKRKTVVYLIVIITGAILWVAALHGKIFAVRFENTAWWGWKEIVATDSYWVLAYCLCGFAAVFIGAIQIIKALKQVHLKRHIKQLILIFSVFSSTISLSFLFNLASPLLDIQFIPPIGHILLGGAAIVIGRVAINYRILDIESQIDASHVLFEVSDYVFFTDTSGKIKEVSSAALSVLGYDAGIITAKGISEISSNLNVERFCCKGEMPCPVFKTELITQNGFAVPVKCKIACIKDKHQDSIGYLLIMTDLRDMIAIEDLEKAVESRTHQLAEQNKKLSDEIIERQKAQEALFRIEEKQRAMIHNISDIIAILDKDGIVIYNSPNIQNILGWNQEEIEGKKGLEIVHPEDADRIGKQFSNLAENINSTQITECRLMCKNGNYKVVHMTGTNKLNDSDINGILLNFYDITDRMKIEEEKQIRTNRIQRQQEALLKITNDEALRRGDIITSFRNITEIACNTLDIGNVCILLKQNGDEKVKCIDIYEKSKNSHHNNVQNPLDNNHVYANLIKEGFPIVVNDTLNDIRTKVIKDTIVLPNGITAMIDTPVRMSGKVIGSIVFAETRGIKEWTDDEISFAAQVSDQVTQVILYEERKIMEEKLRLFANTIMSVSECISITDMNDVIIFVNESFCKTYGYSEEELIGRHVTMLRGDKNEPKHVKKILKDTINGGWEGELWNRKKDGTDFPINLSTSVIKDENEKPIALVGLATDITERKKEEDELRLSEQMMRLHIENTPLGVIEWDKNFNVASWNPAAERIFGYTAKEAAGQNSDFLVPEFQRESLHEFWRSLINHKGGGQRSNENITKNGDIILCEWYNTVITSRDGEVIGLASLVMDITAKHFAEEEEKRLLEELTTSRAQIEEEAYKLSVLNEQLIRSEQKLKEINASKDKFFSIIAHDLKSPFLSLMGYSEILSNEYDSLTEEEKKESISSIFRLSNNSYKLLENLLQWSRMQIGKIEFIPEPFNLLYELTPALLLLSQTAKNKNITIQNDIGRKTFVTADKNMINTIVRNLVSNAIKFCNKGGKIIISSKDLENFVEISVIDNGVGIDVSQIKDLFNIDKNMSTKGTANESGTGLGLLLCKEMVEKHGGTLNVRSELQKGSEFKFTIPKDRMPFHL